MLRNILHKTFCGVQVHTWFLLMLACLAGYWPVSSNLFSLKNDAAVYFLPCRYFISESLRSGHLPLWNPFFYMGIPLSGDMQSGAWNPVVWCFSIFGRYNMTMLHYETLLYIFIGGIGIYKLVRSFSTSHHPALVAAVCYMFSGYIIDTAQITVWTGSAAFIPYVFLYFSRMLSSGEKIYVNALKTSIALYLLLTAGYPSFFIMTLYVLFFGLLFIFITSFKQTGDKNSISLLIKANLVMGVFFGLLALPALLSYANYFPYYSRASGTSLEMAQSNPFNPFAVISYLFPLSVTKEHVWLGTDPTARSAFAGLFTIIMLAGIFLVKLNGRLKFVLACSIILFLFSLGDALPVRKFFYNHVPFMNLFRHPGTMRLFTTIGLLMIAAAVMDGFFEAVKNRTAKIYLIAGIATALITALTMFLYSNQSRLFEKTVLLKNNFRSSTDKRSFLKQFYDSISFADAVLLEGMLQLVFIALFIFFLKGKTKNKTRWLAVLFMCNPVLLAQFSIPATLVTQKSPAGINQLIRESPEGYRIPQLSESIADNNLIETASNAEYGFASFYTKKIIQVPREMNPSIPATLVAFDSDTALSKIVMQYPVCYFADSIARYADAGLIIPTGKKVLFTDEPVAANTSSVSSIAINEFSQAAFVFSTTSLENKPFVIFQNYNANWKLTIDGKEAEIKKGNQSFMYAMVDAGVHTLRFEYKQPYIIMFALVSLLAWIAAAVLIFRRNRFSR